MVICQAYGELVVVCKSCIKKECDDRTSGQSSHAVERVANPGDELV
jgi:hypothetical protein